MERRERLPAPSGLRTAAYALVGLLIVSSGGFLRLHRIGEQGLAEGDTVSYYTIAKHWSEGDTTDFYGGQFYRPAVYAMNGLAIRLLGDTDYSIPISNAALDLVSIVLIIAISRRLSGSYLPGLAAALVFALSPFVTYWCRTGMPHAISTFFVLCALAFFVCTIRGPFTPRSLMYDAAAGTGLGFAANTHADLALLGPGFVACQCIQAYKLRGEGRAWTWLFARAGALTLGFALPYALGFLIFGVPTVIEVASHEFKASTFTPAYVQPAPFYRIPYDFLTISSRVIFGHSLWVAALAVVSLAAWCIRRTLPKGAHGGDKAFAYVPWILAVSYVVFFPFTIGAFDRSYVRVLIPLVPLVLIGTCCSGFALARVCPRRAVIASLAIAAAASLWAAITELQKPHYFQDKNWFSVSRTRGIHDLLGDRVDDQHKLLIVPSTAYHTRGFQVARYFGPNAQFLVDQPRSEAYTPEFLARIARDGPFSYIYFTNFVDLRINGGTPLSGVGGKTWYRGPGDAVYAVEHEMSVLNDFTAKYRAHRLFQTEWGDVFSLRKRPVFPNSDFAAGALDHWHPEGDSAMFAPRNNDGAPPQFYIDTRAEIGKTDAPQIVNSAMRGTGQLSSDLFRIEEGIIGFQIAGPVDPGKIYVALRLADTELRAAPAGSALSAGQWDVSKHLGQQAQLIIADLDPGRNRGLRVESFYYVF